MSEGGAAANPDAGDAPLANLRQASVPEYKTPRAKVQRPADRGRHLPDKIGGKSLIKKGGAARAIRSQTQNG